MAKGRRAKDAQDEVRAETVPGPASGGAVPVADPPADPLMQSLRLEWRDPAELAENRKQKDAPSATTYYAWDAKGRMTTAEPVSGRVTFGYDGAGRRVEKQAAGDATQYVWDFEKVLQEADASSGATENQYLTTDRQYGDLVSGYGGGQTRYYELDALGSAEALLDDSASVTDRYSYRAFGLADQTLGGDPQPYTWVGKLGYQRDQEIDLYYLGAGAGGGTSGRFYGPEEAVFLSPDPLGESGGSPNLYVYCNNDPINCTDPSGHEHFFIGQHDQIARVLTEKGIRYSIYDVTHVFTETNLPGGRGLSSPTIKVIVIDADDIEIARVKLFNTSGVHGLFSFTEHTITVESGPNGEKRFAILKGEQKPNENYWGRVSEYMGYYPGINYLLRLNDYAGYAVPDLLDAQRGIPLHKRGDRPGTRPPLSRVVSSGMVSQAYRRYRQTSRRFPLRPGGFPLRDFIKQFLLPLVPFGLLRRLLERFLDSIPAETFDSLVSALLAITNGNSERTVLRAVVEALVGNLISDKDIRNTVLGIAASIIDDKPLDSATLLALARSLLKLDKRTVDLSVLLGLLAEDKIDCNAIEDIITSLTGINKHYPKLMFAEGDLDSLKNCCKLLNSGNATSEDIRNRILDFFRLKGLDNIVTIVEELRRKQPDLEKLTGALIELLQNWYGANDPFVTKAIEALKVVKNAAAVIKLLKAARKDLKNEDEAAAVDKVAAAAKAAGAVGVADFIRANRSTLITVIGILGALGLSEFLGGGADDCELKTGSCWRANTLVQLFDDFILCKVPIERLNLGENVPTLQSGEPGYQEALLRVGEQFHPETHRALWFVQEQTDHGQTEAGLIRSLEWMASHGIVKVGDRAVLEWPEMGMVGEFTVVALESCPEIKQGPGRTVTGVFRHRRGGVYNVWVEGEQKPLGVTGKHPFWSVDRKSWVPTIELRPGERLSPTGGLASVEKVEYSGEEPVYNLEVDADHCYRVGEQGILVHNQSEQQLSCASCDEAAQQGLPSCSEIDNPRSGDQDRACRECNPDCANCKAWGGRNAAKRKSFFLDRKPSDQVHYMCSPLGQRDQGIHPNSVVCGFCCEERIHDGAIEVWMVRRCVCQQ